MAKTHWTREENLLVVDEYFKMLEQQLADQSFVKLRVIERVQDATGRSKGSVESKFMNISAVLLENQIPYVRGYRPFKNYQASLATVVNEFLRTKPVLRELLTESVTRGAVPRTDLSGR